MWSTAYTSPRVKSRETRTSCSTSTTGCRLESQIHNKGIDQVDVAFDTLCECISTGRLQSSEESLYRYRSGILIQSPFIGYEKYSVLIVTQIGRLEMEVEK